MNKYSFICFLMIALLCCESKKTVTKFYENGAVKSKVELVSNGVSEVYHYYENGNLKQRTQWSDGAINGKLVRYYPTGELESIEYWREGKPHGSVKFFYPNGRLEQFIQYRHGVEVDTSFFYYEDGKLKEKHIHNQKGVMIDFYKYDTEGKKMLDYTRPLIIAEHDTISAGEIYQAEIRLGNRLFDSLKVVIGELDATHQLKDTLQIITSSNFVFPYNIKPDRPGLFTLTGIIQQFEVRGDTTEIWQTPFRHSFLVRDRTK